MSQYVQFMFFVQGSDCGLETSFDWFDLVVCDE